MVTPMSATPLAMENRLGLSPKSYLVSACIVSHVVSMFLPGFFTGAVLQKKTQDTTPNSWGPQQLKEYN
eukprot:4371124-Amphidinium_carterae.4